jgi:glutamate-1-semialdehyde aminotransferase
MQNIAPKVISIRQATLSGNPIAMAAGLATLRLLRIAAYIKGLRLEENRCSAVKGCSP